MHHWLVICPENDVAGLWSRWHREKCVAVGWKPPKYSLDGPPVNRKWAYARNRLREMEKLDKIIPYLPTRRIASIGTIIRLKINDKDWADTVDKGGSRYKLGRRIKVRWHQSKMPPEGMVAKANEWPKGLIVRRTIQKLSKGQFNSLRSILFNPSHWINISTPGGRRLTPRTSQPPRTPQNAALGKLQPAKPKADTEYLSMQHIIRKKRRARKHMTILNDLVKFLKNKGLIPLDNKAIDLATRTTNGTVIYEIKPARRDKALPALRAAIGQLYEYRYFGIVSHTSFLCAVIPHRPPSKVLDYMERDRRVGVLWKNRDSFNGPRWTMSQLEKRW